MKSSTMLILKLTIIVLAITVLIGCPEKTFSPNPQGNPTPGSTSVTSSITSSTNVTTTGGNSEVNVWGTGTIKGTIEFKGTPPIMKVPKKRSEADICKNKKIKHNAVVIKNGKLKDVFIGIMDEQLESEYSASVIKKVDQQNCVYVPRIQSVLVDQQFIISNSDATTHNINSTIGSEVLFNKAHPKGALDINVSYEEPGIYRLKCDIHPWMRAFVIVTDNPFNTISNSVGSYTIKMIPPGTYKLVAWHSQFGKKTVHISIEDNRTSFASFTYDEKDSPPTENIGELDELF